MSGWRRRGFALLLLAISLAAVFTLMGAKGNQAAPVAQDASQGQALYVERCAVCHGIDGDGQGPAAERLFVKPRDFTRDEYKIKSTFGDEFPSREDIIGVIANGMPGTSMPAWTGVLSNAEMGALSDHIQGFGRFFSQEGYGTTAIEVPSRPRADDESIERGRVLYHEEIECFKCHGLAGRGDGPSAFELTDNAGNVTYPTDLTQRWFFRGGPEPEDIYLRLQTGLTGSPMPSFADALSQEDTWHLVNYVLSLGPEELPEPAVILESNYMEGPLPRVVDDPAWDESKPAYYPLTGHIMQVPRYYQPFINSVTVRSLHNDSEVALLVSWNDRTETREGETVDAVAVQFPQEQAEGNERPYFVFGDPERAVYQWYWSAGMDNVIERNANGLEVVIDQVEDQQHTVATSRFEDGQWQVLFSRSLNTGDGGDVVIDPDRFIPVALMAWDGFSDEVGPRMGLTTWSQAYLPSPTPLIEYFWIPIVIATVAVAELLLLWIVRRRAERGRSTVS